VSSKEFSKDHEQTGLNGGKILNLDTTTYVTHQCESHKICKENGHYGKNIIVHESENSPHMFDHSVLFNKFQVSENGHGHSKTEPEKISSLIDGLIDC
jgi:hypothetical protein